MPVCEELADVAVAKAGGESTPAVGESTALPTPPPAPPPAIMSAVDCGEAAADGAGAAVAAAFLAAVMASAGAVARGEGALEDGDEYDDARSCMQCHSAAACSAEIRLASGDGCELPARSEREPFGRADADPENSAAWASWVK